MSLVQSWVTFDSFWEAIYKFPSSKTLVKKKEKHPGVCSKSASLEMIGKEQFERSVESRLWSQAKPRENNPQKGTGNIPHKITLWPHVHRQLFSADVAITLWGEGCPSPRTAVSAENQSCPIRISSLALARFPDKVDLCRCCCFYKCCLPSYSCKFLPGHCFPHYKCTQHGPSPPVIATKHLAVLSPRSLPRLVSWSYHWSCESSVPLDYLFA